MSEKAIAFLITTSFGLALLYWWSSSGDYLWYLNVYVSKDKASVGKIKNLYLGIFFTIMGLIMGISLFLDQFP